MVMTNKQALAQVTAAYEAASNGGAVPTELRCRYPSKRCDELRTTKRGGGLHRLCSFHRQRANKNQYLVDQRRRARLGNERALHSKDWSSEAPVNCIVPELLAVETTLDSLAGDELYATLCDEDLEILQVLLLDEDDADMVDICHDQDEFSMTDTLSDWLL